MKRITFAAFAALVVASAPAVVAAAPATLTIAQAGGVQRVDGVPQTEPLREALITRDRKTVYRVDDGIPVLLIEEGIAATAA